MKQQKLIENIDYVQTLASRIYSSQNSMSRALIGNDLSNFLSGLSVSNKCSVTLLDTVNEMLEELKKEESEGDN